MRAIFIDTDDAFKTSVISQNQHERGRQALAYFRFEIHEGKVAKGLEFEVRLLDMSESSDKRVMSVFSEVYPSPQGTLPRAVTNGS